MCHSENIYGDKHKKQPDARKLLEYSILLVVACLMFFMFIALLWAKCSHQTINNSLIFILDNYH